MGGFRTAVSLTHPEFLFLVGIQNTPLTYYFSYISLALLYDWERSFAFLLGGEEKG